MTDHTFVIPRCPAPVRRSLMLLVGLLAVIAGILGMHTLGISHQAAPGHAAMASSQPASHDAGSSHGSHTGHGTPHADGSFHIARSASHDAGNIHTSQGVTNSAATLTTADPDLHSATCAGHCGGEHTMEAACVFLVVPTGLLLAFLLQRHHVSGTHGLRAPPPSPSWIRATPRPPSLLELSVSRT
jgi:hypothetical protein